MTGGRQAPEWSTSYPKPVSAAPVEEGRPEVGTVTGGGAAAPMADACSRLLVDSVPRSELLRITQLQSEMSRPPPETLPRTHGTS